MDFTLPYSQGTGSPHLQNVSALPLYLYFYGYLINFCHPHYDGSMNTRITPVFVHYFHVSSAQPQGVSDFVTQESPGICVPLSSATGLRGMLGTLGNGIPCPLERWSLGHLLTLPLS